MRNIEMMNVAFSRLWEQGYTVTYYGSGVYHHVSLHKTTTSNATIKTEGTGKDFLDAFEKAVVNFPNHPLDGTIWRTQLLEAPKEKEDAI